MHDGSIVDCSFEAAMRSIFIILISCFISGCAVTDRYAERAQTFNDEADNYYDRMILLNIVRASYRAPLQFSELQSVSGQTTSSGTLGFSTPIGGFPAGTPRMLNPSVGGSTQAIFGAAVQNSQEFYQGISTPLSPVQASYFVKNVGPKELIYGMLFANVTIFRDNNDCKDPKRRYLEQCALVFQNNPRDFRQFNLFQATLGYLIRLGFSMQNVRIPNRDIKFTFNGTKVKEVTDERKDDSQRDLARYCFRPRFGHDDDLVTNADYLCGRSTAEKFFEKNTDENDQSPAVTLHPDFVHSLETMIDRFGPETDEEKSDEDHDDIGGNIRSALKGFDGTMVRVELTTRSTLDIFDYLGSVLRQARDGSHSVTIKSRVNQSLSEEPCAFMETRSCRPIFALAGESAGGISAEFRGATTFIAPDGVSHSYGIYTIAILKRILGLNTSSKNVPTPVILTTAPAP